MGRPQKSHATRESSRGSLDRHHAILRNRDITSQTPGLSRGHRALLENTLPYLSGATDQPPMSFSDLSEPERCALAARISWSNGDAEVRLDELTEEDAGYDGDDFAVGYRKSRYPNG